MKGGGVDSGNIDLNFLGEKGREKTRKNGGKSEKEKTEKELGLVVSQ